MAKQKTQQGSGVPSAAIEQIPTADLIPYEVWLPIPGHSGYEASSSGRVRSCDRTTSDGRRVNGRVLKAWLAGEGYEYVSLGASFKGAVHRIVTLAFHGPPSGLRNEVSHKDGTKTNNAATNLAWATHSENEQEKRMHGTYTRPRVFWAPGQKKRGPQVSRHENADQIISDRNSGMTLSCLAQKYGMSKSGMHGVLRRRV